MLLHELALDPAAADDDAPALITEDGTWTRDELRSTVAELGGAATALAPVGGRIAVLSDNRPEVVALLLAIPSAGRVAVPLNVRLTPSDIVDQLDQTGAVAIIGTDDELGRLGPSLHQVRDLETVVGLEPGGGDISLESLVAAPVLPQAQGHPTDGDPAWLIATSGTTGQAKEVVLTARSLGAAVEAAARSRPLVDDDVYLYPFPLYHVAAYNVLHVLSRGRPVVLPRRFDAAVISGLVEAHGVTAMSLAPTMLRMLLDHRAAQPDPSSVLTGLRTVAYGAAPMPTALLAEADAALGVGFAQGYGMTELSGNAVFLSPDDHRRGLAGDDRLLTAAGWPAPGVEVRIADEEGRPVLPGEPGEVCVRSDQVCSGYWADPAATDAAWRDGWFRTGDVGTLDDDGLLTIVDRAKDIIVTGGENVASREVEDAIGHHALVARVAVVGLPDERWGEAICAVVVVRPGAEHDPARLPADIIAHARARLAGYKVPKRVVLAPDLPLNASGKVVKADLRRQLAAGGGLVSGAVGTRS